MDFVLEALTALSAVAAAQPPSDKRTRKNPRADGKAWWPPFEPDPIATRKNLPISRLVREIDEQRIRN